MPAAETARVFLIIAVTYVISIGHFPHSIAGSVDVFFAVVTGRATYADFVLRFLLPVLSGNVLGGTTLVAALAHAEVAADRSSEGRRQMRG